MGNERSAHEVVVNLPKSPSLGELHVVVLQELDPGRDELAGDHVGVVKHSRDIFLKESVPVRDDTLLSERLIFGCRIFINKYSLGGVLLLIGDPDEIIGDFLEIVPGREMDFTADHLIDHLGKLGLLIKESIGYHPVSLRLLDRSGDILTIVPKDHDGGIRSGGIDLDDTLRFGPDISTVDDSLLLDGCVHIEYDNIPVVFEHVRKGTGGEVDKGI